MARYTMACVSKALDMLCHIVTVQGKCIHMLTVAQLLRLDRQDIAT